MEDNTCIHVKCFGYDTTMRYDDKRDVFFGRVEGILDMVTYEGKTPIDALFDFAQSVYEYCKYRE